MLPSKPYSYVPEVILLLSIIVFIFLPFISNTSKEILDVRNGNVPYDELIKYSDSLELELNIAYENSKLRHSPDFNEINKLLIRLSL